MRSRPIPPKLAARLATELATPPRLSPREVDCLALFACGLTHREAAARLHLSPLTVQSHTKRIRAKLNARTTTQAVALALVRGYLDPALIDPEHAPQT